MGWCLKCVFWWGLHFRCRCSYGQSKCDEVQPKLYKCLPIIYSTDSHLGQSILKSCADSLDIAWTIFIEYGLNIKELYRINSNMITDKHKLLEVMKVD